jgi:type I restriction enzyme, S subunit
MHADWMQMSVGELLSALGGDIKTGPFGTKLKAGEYTLDGVPVISVGEVHYGRLTVHDDTPRVNDSVTRRMPEYLLKEGDIVFGRKGAVDRSARVRADQSGWFLGSDGIRLRLPDSCDSAFVAYQFQQKAHRAWMLQHAAGSTMPSLNEGMIRRIPIVLAPIEEQRAIAAVLGSLDDKIEQNRRTGRVLEGLARATFKAWFVDFEPVKTKAAGASSFPGMPATAFAALSLRLTDSPLGPVPQGWEVSPLSRAVKLTMGQSPKSEFYNGEGRGLPFHQGVTDYGFRYPADRVYSTSGGRLAEPNDVLLSVRAPVGRINVADRQLILGRGVAGLRHLEDQQSFLLYQLFHTFPEEDAIGDGTIYKAVNKDFLSGMPLLVPPPVLRQAFEVMARPLDELIVAEQKESSNLAALRDYLLPQLLSGRVRVGPLEPEVNA